MEFGLDQHLFESSVLRFREHFRYFDLSNNYDCCILHSNCAIAALFAGAALVDSSSVSLSLRKMVTGAGSRLAEPFGHVGYCWLGRL